MGRLYGSSPRQKLEIAETKLRRILGGQQASPEDINREAGKLQREVQKLQVFLDASSLPPAA